MNQEEMKEATLRWSFLRFFPLLMSVSRSFQSGKTYSPFIRMLQETGCCSMQPGRWFPEGSSELFGKQIMG